MFRRLFTGVAALTLMTGAAFAQDYRNDTTARGDVDTTARGDVVVYSHPDPVVHVVRGGAIGAGVGALVGCLVTLPVCGPGAAVGAAIGGGGGAVVGAANTPTRDHYYRTAREDYPPSPAD